MKTIIVIYTNEKVYGKKINSVRHYTFNTESDVKEGDLLNSPSYSTNMQVIKVLDKEFKYVNLSTGELSENFNSTQQVEIRKLTIQEDNNDIIAVKINKNEE